MKKQLQKLLILQKHDINVKDLEEEKEKLPKEVIAMKKDVSELETILQTEIERLKEIEHWKITQETSLNKEEERIKKQLEYVDRVSNSREYIESQKAIDSLRRKAKDHETEILKLMDVVEEHTKVVNERKEQVKRFWTSVKAKEENAKTRLKDISVELEKHNEERVELEKGIEKTLVRKYRFLYQRRFPPMVEAKNERCTACNMNLPPQLFNSMYTIDKVQDCPHCQRIIYIDDALNEN
jgi:uncharacterized protein